MTTNVLRMIFFYVGDESTLFVVLLQGNWRSYLLSYSPNWERKLRTMIGNKLALIPGTKLVVTTSISAMRVEESISSETLEVNLSESGALIAMLELLNKRLETLDLISVMLEFERNLLSDINFTGSPTVTFKYVKICLAFRNFKKGATPVAEKAVLYPNEILCYLLLCDLPFAPSIQLRSIPFF